MILVVEKRQSDTSRLLITIGIHQKEQLQYLENIQNILNKPILQSNSFDINANQNQEEDILYSRFPATSLEVFNKLDDEVKSLKCANIDVYNSLVIYLFIT